ncbi:MAG: OadG family transporter subunit [Eubacteriales bacterium]|nr:OadG family transporter subunit [Eubacteriales bacterium]
MRKFKGLLFSVSVAAMLAVSQVPALAEETETTAQATEAVSEAEAATEAVSEAAEAAVADESGLTAQDRQALESYAEESIKTVTSMSDEEMGEILHPTSILSIPQESVVLSVESWQDAKEELGEFTAVKEHDITVTDDIISINSTCDFANGEGVVTTTLSRDTLGMESMSFSEQDSSLGKVMVEAALNTVMGIGIVFLTLLFLSFLIGQFKHISKLEEAFTKKSAPAPAAPEAAPAVSVPAASAAPAEEEVVDDGELIAVIAAAIAAAEGTTTDGFVVRSIRKSNRNKWQRA